MSSPSISAIMPVRDCERYIGEALDSIAAQTLPPTEVVVVDDGSVDRTVEAVREHPLEVTLETQEPLGIGAAVNRGLAASSGEVIAFLDADDLWMPRKLEVQTAALGGPQGPEAVFGWVEQFVSPDLSPEARARLQEPPPPVAAKLKGTLLMTREAADRVGPFSTAAQLVDFVDWWLRAEEAGVRDVTVGEVVLRRRIHETNVGRTISSARPEYARTIAEALRRRRRAASGAEREPS